MRLPLGDRLGDRKGASLGDCEGRPYDLMPIEHYFARWLPAVEDEMRAIVAAPDLHAFAGLYGMIYYHLGWADTGFNSASVPAGKRIRPMLCLLACEGAGGDPEAVLPAAAALELLHNFSLIHDDIEDGSDLRRGRPTLWKVWGVPKAINAGDTLYTLAHSAFHRMGDRGVPIDRQVEAHLRFCQTCARLTHGQHLDLDFESRDRVTVDEYIAMIEGKTAALLAGSVAIGAIIAGSSHDSRYAEFGLKLGLAFQIQDDLLGIWGDPAVTGKSAASDIASRKKSLPVLYGLENSRELRELYAAPEIDVEKAVELLELAGAKEYAAQIANDYTQHAMAALDAAGPQGEAGAALRELAASLLGRQS